LNCGYGRGYSVREVLDTVERIAGVSLNKEQSARRAGDPPTLVAEASRIRELLSWQPRYDDLDTIVSTALQWERKLAAKPYGTGSGAR
jgi:UDP-glucose 4-epimerase